MLINPKTSVSFQSFFSPCRSKESKLGTILKERQSLVDPIALMPAQSMSLLNLVSSAFPQYFLCFTKTKFFVPRTFTGRNMRIRIHWRNAIVNTRLITVFKNQTNTQSSQITFVSFTMLYLRCYHVIVSFHGGPKRKDLILWSF